MLPHDSYGNICGKSKNFENKKYLLFYDITECLSFFTTLSCPTKQVCVEKCSNQTLYNKISSHVELLKQYCDNTSCPNYVIQSENILGRCVPSILKKFTDSLVNLSVTAFDPQQSQNITIESINEGPLTLGLLEKVLRINQIYLKRRKKNQHQLLYYLKNKLFILLFFLKRVRNTSVSYLI